MMLEMIGLNGIYENNFYESFAGRWNLFLLKPGTAHQNVGNT